MNWVSLLVPLLLAPPAPHQRAPIAPGSVYPAPLEPLPAEPFKVPTGPARPDGKPLTAEAYGVVEVGTGDILYGHNLAKRLFPASLTKVMTALLCIETVEAGGASWDQVVTISEAARRVPESGMWLTVGEHLTLRELLIGVIVRSANDAAYQIAEVLGGGDPRRFVARMNQRARELGAIDTQFLNPHGLHESLDDPAGGDGHYSTAYDLLLFTLEAWKHPFFREMSVMDRVPVAWENLDPDPKKRHPEQRILYNRNKLLFRYDECIGIKTGSTKQAGACLLSAARRGPREVIAVTMKSANGEERWLDSEALLRYALDNFECREVLRAGASCGKMEVSRGTVPAVEVLATETVRQMVHREAPWPTVRIVAPRVLPAPLLRGVPLGSAEVVQPDGRRRAVRLVAAADVPLRRSGVGLHLFGAAAMLWIGLLAYGTVAEGYRRRGRVFA